MVAPTTVDEAVEVGSSHLFDVLVSDWRLPDGHDGMEILAAARRGSPRIAAILISAEADRDLTTRALGAGFRRVMLKPLEASEIVNAVQVCAA